MSVWRLLLYSAALLSLLAAAIHAVMTPEHFEEWWGYGLFFLVAAVAQALLAGALLLWPQPALFLAGIVSNLAIILLYAVTRTAGIPLFGPEAGEIESVGAYDLIATAAEALLIVALAALLALRREAPARGAAPLTR